MLTPSCGRSVLSCVAACSFKVDCSGATVGSGVVGPLAARRCPVRNSYRRWLQYGVAPAGVSPALVPENAELNRQEKLVNDSDIRDNQVP